MTATTTIHVHLDEKVEAEASARLAQVGLSVPEAIRAFLVQVVTNKELPLPLRQPNAETLVAMAEVEEIARSREARFQSAEELFDDLEKNSGH